MQRTKTESPGGKALSGDGGFSFEQYLAYKKHCEDSSRMASEHMFYGFDLKSHNANAEQIEKVT